MPAVKHYIQYGRTETVRAFYSMELSEAEARKFSGLSKEEQIDFIESHPLFCENQRGEEIEGAETVDSWAYPDPDTGKIVDTDELKSLSVVAPA